MTWPSNLDEIENAGSVTPWVWYQVSSALLTPCPRKKDQVYFLWRGLSYADETGCVDGGPWIVHDGITLSQIQGQGQGHVTVRWTKCGPTNIDSFRQCQWNWFRLSMLRVYIQSGTVILLACSWTSERFCRKFRQIVPCIILYLVWNSDKMVQLQRQLWLIHSDI